MENTQTPANSEIDEILKETEIGSWISEHKTMAIALVVLSLLGVIGYGVYNSVHSKSVQKYNELFYQFREGSLKPFSEKKIDKTKLMSSFESVAKETSGYIGLTSLTMQVSDVLNRSGDKESALKLLEGVSKSNAYLNYLLGLRKAALYEDLGKSDMAIKTLEALTEGKVKILEGKVYLDLGRLYLAKGEKEKAKQNLQYVIDNSKENEFIKQARLFISEL